MAQKPIRRQQTRPHSLHASLIRRQVELQERIHQTENLFGVDSRQAEDAVKKLADFVEDAGTALDAAITDCPPEAVWLRVRGSETIYQEPDP